MGAFIARRCEKRDSLPQNIAQKVQELAEPYAAELSLEIWDIVYKKEGSDWYLRIFIDKDGGVSVDDCVDFTHLITKPLDEADPISQSYTLEVSSPGIERELKADWHFNKYIGSRIFLRTIRPVNGVRDFAGVLKAYENRNITVETDSGETMTLAKKEVSFVKLDDFDIDDFNK